MYIISFITNLGTQQAFVHRGLDMYVDLIWIGSESETM